MRSRWQYKKSYGHLLNKQPEVTYQFIKEHSSLFPVEKMCQILEISRSGYYDWEDRPPSKREIENKDILRTTKKSYDECHRIYGLDKLLADVKETYPKCNRKRLYWIQKEQDPYPVVKYRKK